MTEIRDYKSDDIDLSGWDPVTKEVIISSDAASNATAEVVSLPSSGRLSVNKGGDDSQDATDITTVPFHLASGDVLKFTPTPGTGGTTVEFEYKLTAFGSETSDAQKVEVKIIGKNEILYGIRGTANIVFPIRPTQPPEEAVVVVESYSGVGLFLNVNQDWGNDIWCLAVSIIIA